LTNLTEASSALRMTRTEGPETALGSAWQLAMALGGSPTIEDAGDRKVRVKVLLSLERGVSPA